MRQCWKIARENKACQNYFHEKMNPAVVSAAKAVYNRIYFSGIPLVAARVCTKFIERLEINKNAYIFAVASCGGLPVNALNDFSQILEKKGARVSYSGST